MSGQPQDRPSDDVPDERSGSDPTAIPRSSPFAPQGPDAYGTAPIEPGSSPAVVPPPARRGLTKRQARLITSLSPFVALVLFFVLADVDGLPAWLAFLLIPLAGIVTEHLRADRRDEDD